MATEFSFLVVDFDLDDLRDLVSAAVGETVAVVASWPSGDQPGTVRFERDVEGDQAPLDLDPTVVEQALAAARVKEAERDRTPLPTRMATFLAELRAARTDPARWAVIDQLLEHFAAQEATEGQQARSDRARLRESRMTRGVVPDSAATAFTSPRDQSRPGVLFTAEQRIARARAQRESG